MDAIVYDKVSKESDKLATLLLGTYPQETISNADMVSFDDGADNIPVKSMSVSFEPQQDLHGYDHPWPAGGGKNILPISMDNESSVEGGVTVTVVRDTDGNAIGINLNGTCTNSTTVYITGTTGEQGVVEPRTITLKPGKYYLLLADGGAGAAVRGAGNWEGWKAVDSGSSVPPVIKEVTEDSPTEYTTGSIAIYLFSGNKYSNATIKPMICSVSDVTTVDSKGNTVIDYTFSPYSNICPIEGYTGCNISHCGFNLFDGITWKYFTDNKGVDTVLDNARSTGFIPTPFDSLRIVPTYFEGITFPLDFGLRVIKFDKNKSFIKREIRISESLLNNIWNVSNCAYIKVQWLTTETKEVGIKKAGDPDGAIGDSYQISWETEAGTVYGGSLNVITGMLTITHKYAVLSTAVSEDSGEECWWNKSGEYRFNYVSQQSGSQQKQIAEEIVLNASNAKTVGVKSNQLKEVTPNQSYAGTIGISVSTAGTIGVSMGTGITLEEFHEKIMATPIEILYPLKESIHDTLTPQQITTLLRSNNIWSNIGKISLTYRVDPGRYLVNTINRMILDNEVIAS